jgi:hypothetical protein
MKHIIIPLVFFLCLAACHDHEISTAKELSVDVKNQYPVEDIFEEFYSIPLETVEENLISGIDKIQTVNDKYYILDKKRHTIYLFDKNGFFIKKIEKRGQGPMEYIDIADFFIVDSYVYILSRIGRKIVIYNEDEEFVENLKLDDYYDYFYLDKYKNIFLYSNYSNGKRHNIILLNSKGIVLKEFLPFLKNQSFSFSPGPFSQSGDDSVFVTQQYDYNIYSVNKDSVTAVYRLNFNTEDKIPENFEDIGFENIYKDLADKSVVTRIKYVGQNNECLYMIYNLDHNKYISRINTSTSVTSTSKLEFNDRFPFVFSDPVTFCNNYLISYLDAAHVLIFDKKFKSDKNDSGILDGEDNPVLFFHKLK